MKSRLWILLALLLFIAVPVSSTSAQNFGSETVAAMQAQIAELTQRLAQLRASARNTEGDSIIAGIEGPRFVRLGESASWRVALVDGASTDKLRSAVRWGDESSFVPDVALLPSVRSVGDKSLAEKTIHKHIYSDPGNYEVVFMVSTSEGTTRMILPVEVSASPNSTASIYTENPNAMRVVQETIDPFAFVMPPACPFDSQTPDGFLARHIVTFSDAYSESDHGWLSSNSLGTPTQEKVHADLPPGVYKVSVAGWDKHSVLETCLEQGNCEESWWRQPNEIFKLVISSTQAGHNQVSTEATTDIADNEDMRSDVVSESLSLPSPKYVQPRHASSDTSNPNSVTALCAAFDRITDIDPPIETPGPLKVSLDNPRYFENADGDEVYLTGSHTWYNLVDITKTGQPFNWAGYLSKMDEYNHNFIRLWTWWPSKNRADNAKITPDIWQRTGPGFAADGDLKFDLSKFNQAYFDRLRDRVIEAGERDIYVGILLFEGYDAFDGDLWAHNPFKSGNNINGFQPNPDIFWTLSDPDLVEAQETYVRKVIDSVNDLDNVLYEICNECIQTSKEWQHHMVDFVKSYQATKPKQHPVGISSFRATTQLTDLTSSAADWIAYANGQWNSSNHPYITNPPATDGTKVWISDSDHVAFGVFEDSGAKGREWAWKSFARGMNPILMEPTESSVRNGNCLESNLLSRSLCNGDTAGWREARFAQGDTKVYADRMDLASALPVTNSSKCSSKFCLFSSSEVMAYVPAGQSSVTIDVPAGEYTVEKFNAALHTVVGDSSSVTGGSEQTFTAPGSSDWVVFLYSAPGGNSGPSGVRTGAPVITKIEPMAQTIDQTVNIFGENFSSLNNSIYVNDHLVATNVFTNIVDLSIPLTVPSELTSPGGLRVEVTPGTYRVRVENSSGLSSEDSPLVVVSDGGSQGGDGGVGTENYTDIIGISYPPVTGADQLAFSKKHLKELGVDKVRFSIHWDDMEPRKGDINWGGFDARMEFLAKNDLKAHFTLPANGPSWACRSGGNDNACVYKNDNDVARFVEKLFARYPGRITQFQFGNEMLSNNFYPGDIEDFVESSNVVYRAVKEASPSTNFVLGGFAVGDLRRLAACEYGEEFPLYSGGEMIPISDLDDYCEKDWVEDELEDIEELMDEARFDILDIHLYNDVEYWPIYYRVAQRLARDKPIVITEFGGPLLKRCNSTLTHCDLGPTESETVYTDEYHNAQLVKYLNTVRDLNPLEAYYFKLVEKTSMSSHSKSGLMRPTSRFRVEAIAKPGYDTFAAFNKGVVLPPSDDGGNGTSRFEIEGGLIEESNSRFTQSPTQNTRVAKLVTDGEWSYAAYSSASGRAGLRSYIYQSADGIEWKRVGGRYRYLKEGPLGLLLDKMGRLHAMFTCSANRLCYPPSIYSRTPYSGTGVFRDLVFGDDMGGSRHRPVNSDGSIKFGSRDYTSYASVSGPHVRRSGSVATDPVTGRSFVAVQNTVQQDGNTGIMYTGYGLYEQGKTHNETKGYVAPVSIINPQNHSVIDPITAFSPRGRALYGAVGEEVGKEGEYTTITVGEYVWSADNNLWEVINSGDGLVPFELDSVDSGTIYLSDFAFTGDDRLAVLYRKEPSTNGNCMYLAVESSIGTMGSPRGIGCFGDKYSQMQIDSRDDIHIVYGEGAQLAVRSSGDRGVTWETTLLDIPGMEAGTVRIDRPTLMKQWNSPDGYDPDSLYGVYSGADSSDRYWYLGSFKVSLSGSASLGGGVVAGVATTRSPYSVFGVLIPSGIGFLNW